MKLIGMDREKERASAALQNGLPVLLYGFTGNGKTLLAKEIAEQYARENNIPIIYLQLYPEMTKNSLIGGETLENGSIVVKHQPIVTFGTRGAIFIIDECTHTTEPVLLAFNSLIESPRSTVIGDEIISMDEKTRFIFCGNLPDHTGNISLPTSFANRLFIIKTELLSKEQISSIGKEANTNVPTELLNFVSNIIHTVHDASFPVSPRNMVTFCLNYSSIVKTGYNPEETLPDELREVCATNDINAKVLRDSIMSSLMGHVVFRTDGPKKVAAMLWD